MRPAIRDVYPDFLVLKNAKDVATRQSVRLAISDKVTPYHAHRTTITRTEPKIVVRIFGDGLDAMIAKYLGGQIRLDSKPVPLVWNKLVEGVCGTRPNVPIVGFKQHVGARALQSLFSGECHLKCR